MLGLPPDTSRIEIEREAQKLLGMLELGFVDAKTYRTPVGPRARTAELVRAAVAALRDPGQRLQAELWFVPADATEAAPPPPPASPAPSPSSETRTSTWTGALARLGWGP